MHRANTAQSLVAALVILALAASGTGLFGASGASIRITSPAAGARVSGVVEITASVRSAGRASYVIFGVDGDRPSSTNSPPYLFQLDSTALADGAHRIFAEAYDNYGLIAASKAITIYVRNSSPAKGAAPAVQARRAPATQVAAKPAPPAPRKAAARPLAAPASRVAARPPLTAAPVTVTAAADASRVSAASPTQPARGPAPEPSRTAGSATVSPARPGAAEPTGYASSAAAPVSDLPPVARGRAGRIRGHTVVINGRPVQFSVTPFVQAGRMQAGFRGLFQHLGARVSWEAQSHTARSMRGADTVEVVYGSRVARVNGRPVDMGAAATIRASRMIVPLRFFAQVTGAGLRWDEGTGVASLELGNRAMAERRAE